MKMKSKGFFLLALFIAIICAGFSGAYGQDNKDVTVKDAASLVEKNRGNKDFTILDVRTKEEFDEGHLEGALNIDVKSETFREDIASLDRGKTYLVYCRSGKRSKMAQGIMEEMKFKKVINMKGGFMDWSKEGHPYKK